MGLIGRTAQVAGRAVTSVRGRTGRWTGNVAVTLTLVMLAVVPALLVVVSKVVGAQIRQEATASGRRSAELLARGVIFPTVVRDRGRLSRGDVHTLDRQLAALGSTQPVAAITVWAGDRVVYSANHALIGRRFVLPEEVADALRGRLTTETEHGSRAGLEAGVGQRLQITLPVAASRGAHPMAALDVDIPYGPIATDIGRRTRRINLILLGAGGLIYLLLLPSAIRAGRVLRTERERRRPALVRGVLRGIEQGEFELHYQPISVCRGRRVSGVEALVRWRDPARGLIPPAEFIPAVEETGAIWPLTLCTFELALHQLRAWGAAGWRLPIAVNLSTVTLLDERLPAEFERLLAEYGVPATLMHLEITESALMRDPDTASVVLRRLTDMGFAIIALDDFGTGYSSLARLHELPLDALKIDRAFVARMAEAGDAAVVSSIIDMAHDLSLEVIAEGVEDEETWDRLTELGCDAAQGYWVCRPLPPLEITSWLNRRRHLLPGESAGAKRLYEPRASLDQERRYRWAAFTRRRRRRP